jgi:signal transduction histidine kinase
VRTTTSNGAQDLVINSCLLVLTVIVGIFLIKSVIREVEQREKIEILAKELAEANDRQEKLIHFIGHEVKGYLTDGEFALAGMVEGDFGELPSEVKILATTALGKLRKGVASVTDILRAANLKSGQVSYEMKQADLKDLVGAELIKLGPSAKEKGLELKTEINQNETYPIKADVTQLGEHVIRNLIDNSIKYTPTGSVTVGLSKADGKILFYVKDTGVGISDEDKARLFTEGGHGKDSMKVNVHSTGYGLYIAKNIAEAHGGKVWAESDGPGKGSTFKVEFTTV